MDDTYRFLLGERTLLELPWWWFDALLAWLFLIGMAMWCVGRHMIRLSFGAFGLIVGTAAGAAVFHAFLSHLPMSLLVTVGSLIGAAMGVALYRPGMAGVLAITLCASAPASVLLWTDSPTPELREPIVQGVTEIFQTAQLPTGRRDEQGRLVLKAEDLPSISEPLGRMNRQLADNLSAWWDDLPAGPRWLSIVLVVAGLALGLTVGMIVPSTAATFVSALLGTLLMSGGVRRAGQMLPALGEWLPAETRMLLVWLAAATVIGSIVQCTLFRPSADK
jgi:hypothetical protein